MTLTVDDIRARYTGNRIETDYGDEVRFLLERVDELRADLARVTEERDRLRAEALEEAAQALQARIDHEEVRGDAAIAYEAAIEDVRDLAANGKDGEG